MTNPFLANNAQPSAPAQEAPATPVQTQTPAPNYQAPTTQAANAISTPGQTPGVAKDPFAAPRGGGGDKISEALDQAVVIRPTEYIASMNTNNGPTDAIQADWIVLTGPNQGTKASGLIFQKVLKSELKAILGTPTPLMVGVVVLGQAKGSNNAPYLLAEANDEIKALALQACQAHNWI